MDSGPVAMPAPAGWGTGVVGLQLTSCHPSPSPHRQLGVGAFPVESRWWGVYGPFRDFVRAGCPWELQEALLGFQEHSPRELRRSRDYLSCER